jgi:hypothetical protein
MYFFEIENDKREFANWLQEVYGLENGELPIVDDTESNHVWDEQSSGRVTPCFRCGIDKDEIEQGFIQSCVDPYEGIEWI